MAYPDLRKTQETKPERIAREVQTKRAICEMCGQKCGIEVHVSDGQIVKLIGDRNARSGGFRCEKNVLGALDYHNHPNRLNYPLKRAGAKGEGRWERISWEQALDEIAEKLAAIRDRYGPEAVGVMVGIGSGQYQWLEMRWCNLFGTPNRFISTMNCFAPQGIVECAVYGSDARGAPIPGVTECAVFFSANQSESRPNLWRAIRESKKKGTRIIAIDPRFTKIAEMADLWLQIRPGTDAALAYGLLNVIIREELYDKEFVQKWCLGFDELKSCVRDYSPEVVEGITWIPSDKVIETARVYATSKPAQMCSAWGVTYSHLGRDAVLQFNLAKCALRAITGNLDIRGGDIMTAPAAGIDYLSNMHWDTLINHPLRKRDNLSAGKFPCSSVAGFALLKEAMAKTYQKGGYRWDWAICPLVSPHLIWQAILEEQPYPLKALIINGLNVMSTRTNTKMIYDALKSDNLNLLVTMEHFMRPHGMLADYVLPSADWFEGVSFDPITYQVGEQSVVPKFERMQDYYFWRGLGIRLGQEGYWPDTLEDIYNKVLQPTGMSFREFAAMTGPERDARFPVRYKKYESDGFATASGKIELAPGTLKEMGYEVFGPYKEPPRTPVSAPELTGEYPLILITGGKTVTFMHSRYREIEPLRKRHPDPIVQIHPDVASKHGIASNDWVYIETPEGKVKQKAEVTTRIHPKVVHIEHGWSFPEQPGEAPSLFGVWESTAGLVLPDDPELCDFQGGPPLRALLCKISKV